MKLQGLGLKEQSRPFGVPCICWIKKAMVAKVMLASEQTLKPHTLKYPGLANRTSASGTFGPSVPTVGARARSTPVRKLEKQRPGSCGMKNTPASFQATQVPVHAALDGQSSGNA